MRRRWWTAWDPVEPPRGWAYEKALYDAKRDTHTAQGQGAVHHLGRPAVGRWRLAGQLPRARAHDAVGAGGGVGRRRGGKPADRGFRGLAKAREHWHAPVGDRRTIDRLTDGQRAYNREQAGLRALVEQAIAHLANAWALRRWRGLLYRARDVFRAAGALTALAAG